MKKYDELNNNEKEIIDTIRDFKLSKDHAICSLYSFQLQNLINDYDYLISIRKNIQMKYFKLIEEIQNEKLFEGEINTNLWVYNRENEDNIWKDELELLYSIKNALDNTIKLIESGKVEEWIINKENNI